MQESQEVRYPRVWSLSTKDFAIVVGEAYTAILRKKRLTDAQGEAVCLLLDRFFTEELELDPEDLTEDEVAAIWG